MASFADKCMYHGHHDYRIVCLSALYLHIIRLYLCGNFHLDNFMRCMRWCQIFSTTRLLNDPALVTWFLFCGINTFNYTHTKYLWCFFCLYHHDYGGSFFTQNATQFVWRGRQQNGNCPWLVVGGRGRQLYVFSVISCVPDLQFLDKKQNGRLWPCP